MGLAVGVVVDDDCSYVYPYAGHADRWRVAGGEVTDQISLLIAQSPVSVCVLQMQLCIGSQRSDCPVERACRRLPTGKAEVHLSGVQLLVVP